MKLAGVQNPMQQLKNAISDGSALNKFREMVDAHGGSLESLDDPNTNKPEYCKKIYAETDGFISSMDTLDLGMAVVHLGGGRLNKEDVLDPTVGIIFHKKKGDIVNKGDLLLEYFCSDNNKMECSKLAIIEAIQIQSHLPDIPDLIYR